MWVPCGSSGAPFHVEVRCLEYLGPFLGSNPSFSSLMELVWDEFCPLPFSEDENPFGKHQQIKEGSALNDVGDGANRSRPAVPNPTRSMNQGPSDLSWTYQFNYQQFHIWVPNEPRICPCPSFLSTGWAGWDQKPIWNCWYPRSSHLLIFPRFEVSNKKGHLYNLIPRHDTSGTASPDCLQNGQGWCQGGLSGAAVRCQLHGVSGLGTSKRSLGINFFVHGSETHGHGS